MNVKSIGDRLKDSSPTLSFRCELDSELREEKSNVAGIICVDGDGLRIKGEGTCRKFFLTRFLCRDERQCDLFNDIDFDIATPLNFSLSFVAVDGKIDPGCASTVAAITRIAKKLEPHNEERPVIVIDKADKR